MQRRKAATVLVFAVAVSPLAGGCTSAQKIRVSTEPPGAQVLVDGKSQGVTPGSFAVRQKGAPLITLRKEGYQTASVRCSRRFRPMRALALSGGLFVGGAATRGVSTKGGFIATLAGVAAGLVAGTVSGAFHGFHPSDVNVALEPAEGGQTTPLQPVP